MNEETIEKTTKFTFVMDGYLNRKSRWANALINYVGLFMVILVGYQLGAVRYVMDIGEFAFFVTMLFVGIIAARLEVVIQ